MNTGRRDSGTAAAPNFGIYVTRLSNNGIVQWTTEVKDPLGANVDVSGETVREFSNGDFVAGARRTAGILSMGLMRLNAGGALQFQAATLDHDDYVGRIGIGRVRRGVLRHGQRVTLCHPDRAKPLAVVVKSLITVRAPVVASML